VSDEAEAALIMAGSFGAFTFMLGYLLGKARATARQPLTDRMSFED